MFDVKSLSTDSRKMHLETSSNLYGTTVNPFNRALTSGGSSGGEGALLGLRGSCLGIGSDIGSYQFKTEVAYIGSLQRSGGSIRSPAANNGLYGFRPTTFRIPKSGALVPHLGSGYIYGVIGPLSTSLSGVDLFMKSVIDSKPWLQDPTLVPLPWRGNQLKLSTTGHETLKIGVMWSDGVVEPHPPIKRALATLVEKLRRMQGVEVVEWKPYKHDLAWELIVCECQK